MPYVLFVRARTLSETAIIPMIVLMLYFMDSKPTVSGILAGLMFGVRFQSALFVAPLFFAICLRACFAPRPSSSFKKCIDYALGMIMALCGVGLIDYLTWGSWFHSPVAYFESNIIDDVASSFGVSPWHQYVTWVGHTAFDASIFVVPLAVLGAKYRPHYALAAIGFFVAHSLIGHKESRFVWSMMPIALILVAEGFQRISQRLSRNGRYALAMAGLTSLICAVPSQLRPAERQMRSTKANTFAIAYVGRTNDVAGVAVVGGNADHGNRFYLRKAVPYVIEAQWGEIESRDAWLDRKINYLIAEHAPHVRDAEFQLVKQFNEWKIFLVEHKPTELFDVAHQVNTGSLIAKQMED